MTQTNAAPPPEPLPPLRHRTTPKLGERAIGRLTYQVAISESGAVAVAVTGNGGSGYFSREWVALARIQAVLQPYRDNDQTFPTAILRAAYTNQSQNNSGFLAALLRHEGLLQAAEPPHLHAVAGDWAAWEAEQRERYAAGERLEPPVEPEDTPTKPLPRRRGARR